MTHRMRWAYMILIISIFPIFIYSQLDPSSFPTLKSQDVVASVEQDNPFSNSLLPNQQNVVEDDNGLIKDLDVGTIVQNSIADVSEVKGNDLLKASGVILEGTNVESNLDGNFIPFFNLVDESIMGFDLDKNEKISVKQFKNGLFLNEFQSTLSKGAKLRQFFKDSDSVLIFEAIEDASFFARKDRSYEFENGVIAFKGSNFTEKITTKGKTRAVIDKDFGFIDIESAKDSVYSYESLINAETNFLIENKNSNNYKLNIRKRNTDVASDNFIDLIANKIRLNGIINLKKKLENNFTLIYEGLNNRNKITIDLDKTNSVIKKLFLESSGSGEIANVYTSYYKINERNSGGFIRNIDFNERHNLVMEYSSSFEPDLIIKIDDKGELIQDSDVKYRMISRDSIAYNTCKNLLKGFLGYEDERFTEEC